VHGRFACLARPLCTQGSRSAGFLRAIGASRDGRIGPFFGFPRPTRIRLRSGKRGLRRLPHAGFTSAQPTSGARKVRVGLGQAPARRDQVRPADLGRTQGSRWPGPGSRTQGVRQDAGFELHAGFTSGPRAFMHAGFASSWWLELRGRPAGWLGRQSFQAPIAVDQADQRFKCHSGGPGTGRLHCLFDRLQMHDIGPAAEGEGGISSVPGCASRTAVLEQPTPGNITGPTSRC
jgi:hypothetical protein